MIIGVTGKSGAGKSTLCSRMSNFLHVNVDEVSHKVLMLPENKQKIQEYFQIDLDKMDRKELGDKVFNNRHEMGKLNDLLWEGIQKELDKVISENDNVVLDWILLPHTKYWKMCDLKILVKESNDIRRERVLKRDNISNEYFDARENNSIEYDESDFDIIFN